MKKLSLTVALVENMTSRKERNPRAQRPQTRALRLESLESRELLSVAPGCEFLELENANNCSYLSPTEESSTATSAGDILNFSKDMLNGADIQSNASTPRANSIVVTSADDIVDANDGVVTLREALSSANFGDTITFDNSLRGKTIALKLGQLTTSKTISIDASNLWNTLNQNPGLTLNGQGTSRILYLKEGADVEINGITFADGYITISGSVFSNNKTSGGAIYNNKATLTLNNCVICDNEAFYPAGGEFGGGVYSNDGKTTLNNCTVMHNSGGGVYSNHGETVLANCTVTDNSGCGAYADYGEMTLDNCTVSKNTDSAIHNNGAMVFINNCEIHNNSATNGGGVYSSNHGKTTLTDCTITNNAAGRDNPGANGGAIYNNGATVSVNNCVINDNRAIAGGAVCSSNNGETTLTDCTIANNTCNGIGGGAICNLSRSTLSLISCTLTNNTSTGSDARGGAIYNLNKATLSLTDCTVTNNACTDSYVYGGTTFSGEGGAIYNEATVLLNNCMISDNHARYGGVVYSDGVYSNCETTFTNCTITKNTTSSDFVNGGRGGAFNNNSATLFLENCVVCDNQSDNVGGVYSYNGEITFANCTITNNTAKNDSAGIYLNGTAVLTAYNTIIVANSDAEVSINSNAVTNAYNTLSSFSNWTNGENNLIYNLSKPLFTNAESGDYTLAVTSQAINKGNNEYVATSVDLTGNPRISGKTVDLGAYEYQLIELAAPTNPRETVKTETTIAVAWDAVPNASGYQLSWKNQTDSSYAVVNLDAATTSFTLSELDNGATYDWKVLALGDAVIYGDSDYTESHFVTPRRRLAPPSLSSNAETTSITISWNAIPNADRYCVSYKLANATNWSNEINVRTNLSYAINSLKPNTKYDVRVRAIGDGFDYADSDNATLTITTPQLKTLSKPANPHETVKTETAITVSWNAVSNASGYKLAWKNQTSSSYAYVTQNATTTSYTLTELDNSAIYEWRILAIGDYVNYTDSTYTAMRSVKPRQKLATPTVYSNAKTTSIIVSWDAIPNAVQYGISYKLASTAEWSSEINIETDISCAISGLNPNTKYDVQVRAIADGFNFGDSDNATIIVTTTIPTDEESPIIKKVESRAVASEDEQNELRIVFSEPVQLQELIDDGSIASVFQLKGGNKGVPISLGAAAFKYDAATATLVVSLAGLDDARVKDFAISVKEGVATSKLALLVDSSRVLDLAGNALRGSVASSGADAPDLVLFSELVAKADASSAPSLCDWNGDGALDLVVGEKSTDGVGRVKVYLNQGATDALAYTDSFYATYWDASASCSVEIAVSGEIAPRIADITGDGLDDLLVGLADGTIALYRGAQLDGERVFSAPETVLVGAANAKKTLDVGSEAVVDVYDWNGDGRNDLVVGAANGKVRVYVNASKTAGEYDFRSAATLAVGTADLVVESGCSAPTVADVDGDGVFDVVTGNASGAMFVYLNAGTNATPKFETATSLLDASGEPITLGDATRSRPFAYDVSGDGVADYLVGASDGSVGYYESVRLVAPNSEGTPGAPFSCSISFPFALSNPNAPVYATPTISRVGVADSGEFVLLWSTSDPAEKYAVEYRLQGAEAWTGSGLFATLFGALPSANYGVGNVVQARVRAVASDVKGASDWSKVVQYKISGERPSISVATNVQEVGGVCAVSVVVESNVDAFGRWTIDWNDGSEPTSFVGLSMSRTLSHIYATSGVFAPVLYLDDQEGVALDSIAVEIGSAAKLDAASAPFFAAPPTANARLDAVFSRFAQEPFVGPVMPDRALLARREPTASAREATKSLDRAFADITLDSDVFVPELEDDLFVDEILADFFEETLK